MDFSDRIFEVMGIRPALYANGNYAHYVIGQASSSLKNAVVNTHPVFWNARPEPSANVQTEDPSDYLSWTYGAWDDPPNPSQPWDFWQYSWVGQLPAYSGDLDFNVANGGQDFLKDRLVPALWTNDSDGEWTTLTNWNSGVAPIAPVQGPGQASRRGGRLTLPAVRLPTGNDTVVLDRSGANINVTLSAGDHEIRKLVVREALDITGGSLTVNYTPVAESTPYSAMFSAPVSLEGGSLSVHTLQVDASQTFSLDGGLLTFDTIQLMPHNTAPAKLEVTGDVVFDQLNGVAASIVSGAGSGSSGHIDFAGENRTWWVPSGNFTVGVPITNGGLTKAGNGTLTLNGVNTYEGDTVLAAGTLSIAEPSLDDTADVYASSFGVLNLDFAGTDVVDAFFLDGIAQPAGTWGSIGSGAQFTSPFISGSGMLEVSTFASPLVGDFNNDGSVDDLDLTQWLGDYGANGDSDADADGDSDGSDFLAWQQNSDAGALAATQAVPEASTAALLVGSLLWGFSSRRRR